MNPVPAPLVYDENKVAIVMPLFNDAAHIGRAIECAVAQQMPAGVTLEVIVVDDCSKDDGAAIADDYARRFANVRLIRLASNGGPSVARNAALKVTDAAWFTPFDSDDVMLPTRIANLLERGRTQDLDIVADNLLITEDTAPQTVLRELWPGKPRGDIPLTAELFLARSANVEMARSELGFLKPLIRRRLITGGREAYVDSLRFGEDFELYARLLMDGARAVLTEPEGYYFICRQGSASRSQGREDHRRLALVGRSMLRRKDLTDTRRAALRTYTGYCEREWATWSAIEAFRFKKPARLLEAFTVSWGASAHVARQLANSALSRLTRSGRTQST